MLTLSLASCGFPEWSWPITPNSLPLDLMTKSWTCNDVSSCALGCSCYNFSSNKPSWVLRFAFCRINRESLDVLQRSRCCLEPGCAVGNKGHLSIPPSDSTAHPVKLQLAHLSPCWKKKSTLGITESGVKGRKIVSFILDGFWNLTYYLFGLNPE